MTAKNVLELIGNTPLVKSNHLLENKNITLWFKMEGHNPGGSVKDRPAYNMIRAALERKRDRQENQADRSYQWKYGHSAGHDRATFWLRNFTCNA